MHDCVSPESERESERSVSSLFGTSAVLSVQPSHSEPRPLCVRADCTSEERGEEGERVLLVLLPSESRTHTVTESSNYDRGWEK